MGKMFGLILIVCFIDIVPAKISRHYVTEECGKVLGPEDGAYLEFDRTVKQKKGVINIPTHLKGTLFECMIVIQGMPATKGETRYMAMHWRNFHVQDPAVDTIQSTPADCQKAYVTVHTGADRTAPVVGTFCGKDILSQNFEFEGLTITLYFYIDYRNPDWVTTPAPPVTVAGVTQPSVDATTPFDPFPYPLVYIRLDVTNFDYECNASVRGEVMKCNDSQRCLNDDLRCDFFYSRNCVSSQFPRDRSDTGRFPPAECWVKPTTTTQATTTEPPPPVPFPWQPIVGVAAGLLAILAFLFCCWKPGYIPWRCARLRNVPCLNACGACLSPCCPRCMSPCCLAVSPCCVKGYGPSPTGGAAATRMRELGLLSHYSNDYPDSVFRGSLTDGSPMDNGLRGPPGYLNGGPYPSQPPKKTLKQKLFPCLAKPPAQSGWPVRRMGSVAPSEHPDQLGDLPSQGGRWRSLPLGKVRGLGNSGNLPNGTPSNFQGKSPYDDRDDPEGLATGWLKFLSNDGGHLREQR